MMIGCLLALATLWTACGKDQTDEASTFSCTEDDSTRCEKDSQYCLRTYDGETQLSGTCYDLPSGCSDCDCIQKDDPVTSTCGGFTSCVSVSTSVFRIDCEPAQGADAGM